MKLLFKQQPSFIFRFYVTNQNNEWLYIIKKWQLCINFIYMMLMKILLLRLKKILNQLFFYVKNEEYIGAVEKGFSYFIPYFLVDYRKWNVGGEYVEYNYEIKDENDYLIGRIEKRS